MARTVKAAVLDLLRRRGMKRIYCNPGTTEIPFLTNLPDDFEYVLALHEGSLVAMATGEALATGKPVFLQLHTSAGFGNAVSALASARVNRAPLVAIVGQVDRRHSAHEPFLYGDLEGLAGDYPVRSWSPKVAADVPGAIERAINYAVMCSGPAVVIVPMNDWGDEEDDTARASAQAMVKATAVSDEVVQGIADTLNAATNPMIVAGAANDSKEGWAALAAVAERLDCPVWQEPFGPRAGFPQTHRLFAGHLPAERAALVRAMEPYDVVLVVGTAAMRQFQYSPDHLLPQGTKVVTITPHLDEAARSMSSLSILAETAPFLDKLVSSLNARKAQEGRSIKPRDVVSGLPPSKVPNAISPVEVYRTLQKYLPAETAIAEETPSTRFLLQALLPARAPLGYLSGGTGWLGFALPAALGIKLALPDRPVVGIIGDGSALYCIQALWTAAHKKLGVLFIIMKNGGYAVMDKIAMSYGGNPPWPKFQDIDISGLAKSFGCESRVISSIEELESAIREGTIDLAHRKAPLVLEVKVADDLPYAP